MRLNVFVLVQLIALLITSVASAAQKDGPAVKLNVEQSDFDSGQNVLVSVTFSNPTKHTVRVLKWFTPVDGVEEPLFFVMRDGEPVAYTGAIYKRPAVTGNNYISLKAGESVISVVNLGEYYDLSASGQYEVTYAVTSYNLFDEKSNAFKFRDVLTSEKISFKADGRAAKRPPTPTLTPGAYPAPHNYAWRPVPLHYTCRPEGFPAKEGEFWDSAAVGICNQNREARSRQGLCRARHGGFEFALSGVLS